MVFVRIRHCGRSRRSRRRLRAELKTHAPDGVDVFFDNVGGAALEAALNRLARASMTGFVIFDYAQRYPEGVAQLGE